MCHWQSKGCVIFTFIKSVCSLWQCWSWHSSLNGLLMILVSRAVSVSGFLHVMYTCRKQNNASVHWWAHSLNFILQYRLPQGSVIGPFMDNSTISMAHWDLSFMLMLLATSCIIMELNTPLVNTIFMLMIIYTNVYHCHWRMQDSILPGCWRMKLDQN